MELTPQMCGRLLHFSWVTFLFRDGVRFFFCVPHTVNRHSPPPKREKTHVLLEKV